MTDETDLINRLIRLYNSQIDRERREKRTEPPKEETAATLDRIVKRSERSRKEIESLPIRIRDRAIEKTIQPFLSEGDGITWRRIMKLGENLLRRLTKEYFRRQGYECYRDQELEKWLTSGRTILWIFASSVFGAYAVSLIAALLESIEWYGPMRVFTTGYLANMVLPFQVSIYAWIVGSVLLLSGQFLKPIRRDTIVVGVGSLAFSLVSAWTVGASLLDHKVPWFVSYLQLTFPTKVLIGIVSAFAFAYVVTSPRVWRTKPKKEIADDLKGRLLDRMVDRVEGYLEEHSRKTDRSKIHTYDVSFYVDTCSDEYSPYLDKVEITVEGLCTTPDVKKLSFHGTFSGPDLELVSCSFESISLNDREYS